MPVQSIVCAVHVVFGCTGCVITHGVSCGSVGDRRLLGGRGSPLLSTCRSRRINFSIHRSCNRIDRRRERCHTGEVTGKNTSTADIVVVIFNRIYVNRPAATHVAVPSRVDVLGCSCRENSHIPLSACSTSVFAIALGLHESGDHIDHRRVRQRGDVTERSILRHVAQESSHDLARTSLR